MTPSHVLRVRSTLLAAAPHERPALAVALLDTHGEDDVCAAVELLDAPAPPRDRARWRRHTGRFYTPAATAQRLAERLLADRSAPPRSVLDPACGGGALLVAVFDAIAARWPALEPGTIARSLAGIDVDPVAAAITAARIARRGGLAPPGPAVARDALLDLAELPWPQRSFDLIIANPPFGNAIERETARTPEQARQWRERFPHAARGAYDRASLFVERALQLAAPDAHIGFVLPTAWLVAPSSRVLREGLAARHGPPSVELLGPHEFSAVSNTLALVCWTGRPDRDEAASDDTRPCLGDLAEVRAGMTTAEAYEVADRVQDGGEGLGLVTAGAIDPDVVHWGRPQRYLGRTFLRPTLPLDAIPPNRRADCARERVLVAGLSRHLEAVAVPAGRWVAAVSAIQVIPRPGGLDATALAALLNQPSTREEYARTWAAAALGGRSIPVTAGRLRQLRLGLPD